LGDQTPFAADAFEAYPKIIDTEILRPGIIFRKLLAVARAAKVRPADTFLSIAV